MKVPVNHSEQGWSPSWVESKILMEPCREQEPPVNLCFLSQEPGKMISTTSFTNQNCVSPPLQPAVAPKPLPENSLLLSLHPKPLLPGSTFPFSLNSRCSLVVSLLPVPPACPVLSHRFAFVPPVPATWDAFSFLLHLSEPSPSIKAILNVPFSKSLC